jgi:hypothetical protein
MTPTGKALALAGAGVLGLTACGGSSGHPAHVRSASASQVAACARSAGFTVTTEKFDPAADETAQLGLNTPASVSPGNTLTLAFYSNSSAASTFYKVQGGAKNPGAEPGGNDLVGTVVVSFYAKDAWLTKAERCVLG